MTKYLTLAIYIFFSAALFAGAQKEVQTTESVRITIEHKYGFTELSGTPERVISIGYSEHDTVLALGVELVAVRDWYGDKPYAVWPWSEELLGDSKPVVLSPAELDFELIASLNPDVIVGISSGMSEEEYKLLSEIAPVIAQPSDYIDYGTPWQVETEILGRVLSKETEAEKLVSDLENRIIDIKNSHEEFSGKTAAVSFVYQSIPGAYASQDARSRLISQLGFEIPAIYDELAGDAFYVSFSEERIDLLDTDVILWIASGGKGLDDILELPLRKSLTAAKEGRELFLGEIIAGAFSFASPVSINFLLDELVPGLEAVLDGDASTLPPAALR